MTMVMHHFNGHFLGSLWLAKCFSKTYKKITSSWHKQQLGYIFPPTVLLTLQQES